MKRLRIILVIFIIGIFIFAGIKYKFFSKSSASVESKITGQAAEGINGGDAESAATGESTADEGYDVNSPEQAPVPENLPVKEAASVTDPAYIRHEYEVPGQLIVDFKDNTPAEQIKQTETDLGVTFENTSPFTENKRILEVKVDESRQEEVLDKLKNNPNVEYAEPEFYYHAYDLEQQAAKPNDPLYKYQWNFEKIRVREAWDKTDGGNVVVAVIDTGVSYLDSGRFHRLEDLEKTQFVKGYNFVDKNELALDDNGHGSHVAGTIAQSTNNGKGVAGIAPKVKIMPLKVLSGDGYGKVSDIADAIRYAADHGAKVINLSLGGPFPSLTLQSACEYAWNKGVVIICAAGNSRSKHIGYPAGYSVCVAVSATRFDDELAPYSNRGPKITIAAPGGDTRVDQNGDGKPDGIMQNTIAIQDPSKEGYYIFQGTSMASPHVAAVAALIASSGVTGNKEIVETLKKTARKKNLPLEIGYGAGIVDAKAATDRVTIGRGWIKAVVVIAVLLLIIFFMGPLAFAGVKFSPLFYLGWLFGGCNLFFLPLLVDKSFVGMGFLMRGVADWDIMLFGAGSHQNPLFYSVLIPFVVGVILYGTKLQKFAAGIAAGFAGSLIFALFFSGADVTWLPGIKSIFDEIWLLINAILTFILVDALLALPKEDKIKEVKAS